MRLDTGFRPSRDGFGFANTWRDIVLGMFASRGRCGGMVFAALDAFTEGRPLMGPAAASALPAHGAPLAQLIWKRQVDSVLIRLAANLWQFARFTYLPSHSVLGVASASRRELLPLFDALRSGRPVPLGLVSSIGPRRLATNHQVLAYAADFNDKQVVIEVYDPNHPKRDDVKLVVPLDVKAAITELIGSRQKVWRGFFVEHYSPRCSARLTEPAE